MGDNNNGKVWAVKTDGVSVQDSALEGTVSNLTSFGTDLAGNLYAVSRDGPIYALGGPDLPAVSSVLPGRKTGMAPLSLSALQAANLPLRDLTGKRVNSVQGDGVYIYQEKGKEPALVPVLK